MERQDGGVKSGLGIILLWTDWVLAAPNWQTSLQQAFNYKFQSALIMHSSPLHIEQVFRLPGAVNLDVLHNASLWITLTVPEVVGTEN